MFVPLRTPPEIIAKVSTDLRWALEQSDVRGALEKVGVTTRFGGADELHAQMIRDVEVVEELVRRGVMKVGS